MRWRRGQIRARRLFNRLPLRESQKLHVLTFLIGGLCGLAAVLFHWLLEFFQAGIIYRVASSAGPFRPLLLIVVPAAGGLLAGAALYFYAPEARGSGIPQVKTAFLLEGGRIPARVIPAKMLLPAINIGTGASLGREGPTVQICAAIASQMGRAFDLSREGLRGLVPVGAAAGLAAAFNTPIAAVTFTLEEILGDTAAKPMGSIVIASVIASVVERWLLGEHALFSVPPYRLNAVAELPFYLLLGALAGVVAVAFNVSLLRLRGWLRDQRVVPPWATPAAGGAVVGCLGLTALLWTGSSSIFGVGYQLLATGLQGGLPFRLMLILCAFKLAATVVSYSSGSSGGIFGPSLYIGGMLGGVIGAGAALVLGTGTQPGAFVLVGMGALFAGIVRAPITSIVIIFEMTNNYSIILPLMAANIVSYAVARRLSPEPIYDALLRQDGVQLPHEGGRHLKRLRAGAVMSRDRQPSGEPSAAAAGPLGVARVYPDQTLDSVLAVFGRAQVEQIDVVSRREPGRRLGSITMQDVVRAIARAEEEEAERID